MTTKIWDKAAIVALLETEGDKGMHAIGRALVRLRENQTADEQASKVVSHNNGMGFRPCDAVMGTSMAEFYMMAGKLTTKQLAYWRKRDARGRMRICVYAAQLAREVKAKQAAEVTKAAQTEVLESA